jgi:hypothetical protein
LGGGEQLNRLARPVYPPSLGKAGLTA